ncbi:MAG: hypothetical protein Q8R02_15460 [Hyphomonadaceae bacterium]|nr:hypothetical protein [Hyphomonadaceae bacterium]
MLCCVLTALFAGKFALVGRMAVSFAARRTVSAALMLSALLAGLGLLAPVALAHAGHYAERAKAHDRSILSEILAAPLCSGGGELR